ncbi:MAG: L-aspartate oxidase [Flavobacteriales bacterium]|nr:L-aspartate oxidase [Flavobacteriales bacterium]
MNRTDFLVIGSGVAGLAFAIKVAEHFLDRKVTVVTKSADLESNSRYAQGGIAVVIDRITDSFDKHVADTLTAGDGLCDPVAVRTIVSEGPERLREVMEWGARFDSDGGTIGLGREGGHSENRIVHHQDRTGLELSEALLAHAARIPNIIMLKGLMAIDLLLETKGADGAAKCEGVTLLDPVNGQVSAIHCPFTVLATGGAGQVYATTTNPSVATGDGIAMGQRAGAVVSNMEFIQFHPTALRADSDGASFLISEAVRGAGARLMDATGNYFMSDIHPQADLAPRDIVARAIFAQMKKTGTDHVLLDCTAISERELRDHFPTILEKCAGLGIDLLKDPIPVAPAAHYCCGGIHTDLDGHTSVKGLFAIGECADTGLHGANRLASNSLLEALVMAHRAHRAVIAEQTEIPPVAPLADADAPYGRIHLAQQTDMTAMRAELRGMMDALAGIIRTNDGLRKAMARLSAMTTETEGLHAAGRLSAEGLELRNMVCVARLIVAQSLARKENRGGFYNQDLVGP